MICFHQMDSLLVRVEKPIFPLKKEANIGERASVFKHIPLNRHLSPVRCVHFVYYVHVREKKAVTWLSCLRGSFVTKCFLISNRFCESYEWNVDMSDLSRCSNTNQNKLERAWILAHTLTYHLRCQHKLHS